MTQKQFLVRINLCIFFVICFAVSCGKQGPMGPPGDPGGGGGFGAAGLDATLTPVLTFPNVDLCFPFTDPALNNSTLNEVYTNCPISTTSPPYTCTVIRCNSSSGCSINCTPDTTFTLYFLSTAGCTLSWLGAIMYSIDDFLAFDYRVTCSQ